MQACVTHVKIRIPNVKGNRILTPNFKCSEGCDKKTPPEHLFPKRVTPSGITYNPNDE